MAKNKKKRKPSLFTRARALIAAAVGLGGVWDALWAAQVQPAGSKLVRFVQRVSENYSGYSMAIGPLAQAQPAFNANRLVRGYAPLAGGIAFYIGTGELAKRVSRGLAS